MLPPNLGGASVQFGQLKRREFIALFGGAMAAGRSRRGRSQPMPVVGFVFSGAQQGASAAIKRAFEQGLSDEGYVEGQNVIIKYKWAEGHYDRLPALAADLGSQRVTVLAVGGGTGPIPAVKTANPNVPVVFLLAPIPSWTDWSPVSTGQQAISRAYTCCSTNSSQNRWRCFMSSCRPRRRSRS